MAAAPASPSRPGSAGWRAKLDVALVEPASEHAYQPLWTLVGGGAVRAALDRCAARRRSSHGASTLDQERRRRVRPGTEHASAPRAGDELEYGTLVVAVGLQIDWDAIPGLTQALADGSATSIWSYEGAQRTWERIRSFEGGTALFTIPATPIKCPGAAQKIMYLADDHFRRAGVRDRSRVVFAPRRRASSASTSTRRRWTRWSRARGSRRTSATTSSRCVPTRREAVFRTLDAGEELTVPLRPPARRAAAERARRRQAEPARRPERLGGGRPRDVPPHPLPNVFALGDASSLPDVEDRRGDPRAGADRRREPARGARGREAAAAATTATPPARS